MQPLICFSHNCGAQNHSWKYLCWRLVFALSYESFPFPPEFKVSDGAWWISWITCWGLQIGIVGLRESELEKEQEVWKKQSSPLRQIKLLNNICEENRMERIIYEKNVLMFKNSRNSTINWLKHLKGLDFANKSLSYKWTTKRNRL